MNATAEMKVNEKGKGKGREGKERKGKKSKREREREKDENVVAGLEGEVRLSSARCSRPSDGT